MLMFKFFCLFRLPFNVPVDSNFLTSKSLCIERTKRTLGILHINEFGILHISFDILDPIFWPDNLIKFMTVIFDIYCSKMSTQSFYIHVQALKIVQPRRYLRKKMRVFSLYLHALLDLNYLCKQCIILDRYKQYKVQMRLIYLFCFVRQKIDEAGSCLFWRQSYKIN